MDVNIDIILGLNGPWRLRIDTEMKPKWEVEGYERTTWEI